MTPSRAHGSGWRTFGAGMVLYTVLLVAASVLVQVAEPGTSVRVVLALTPAAAFLWAPPASAHTGFESSTPAEGATVDGPVEVVTLVFTGPAEPTGTGFEATALLMGAAS